MTTHVGRRHDEGDWVIWVDDGLESFTLNVLNVAVARRIGRNGYELHGYDPSGGNTVWADQDGEHGPPEPLGIAIPRAAAVAIGHALIGQPAVSDELVTTLKNSLSIEQARVDKLLDGLLVGKAGAAE
jgi:hypothetical protein